MLSLTNPVSRRTFSGLEEEELQSVFSWCYYIMPARQCPAPLGCMWCHCTLPSRRNNLDEGQTKESCKVRPIVLKVRQPGGYASNLRAAKMASCKMMVEGVRPPGVNLSNLSCKKGLMQDDGRRSKAAGGQSFQPQLQERAHAR